MLIIPSFDWSINEIVVLPDGPDTSRGHVAEFDHDDGLSKARSTSGRALYADDPDTDRPWGPHQDIVYHMPCPFCAVFPLRLRGPSGHALHTGQDLAISNDVLLDVFERDLIFRHIALIPLVSKGLSKQIRPVDRPTPINLTDASLLGRSTYSAGG
jgi:hypothetical protein